MLADWTKNVPPSPWLLGSTSTATPSSARNWSFFRCSSNWASISGDPNRPARGCSPAARLPTAARGAGSAGRLPAAATAGRPRRVALAAPRGGRSRARAGSAASASASSSRVGLAGRQRLEAGGDLADRARQHDRALELALVLGEVGLGLGVEVDDRRLERAVGAGRPRLGVADQRDALGLDHLRREPLERPAAAERPPGLEVGVRQPPAGQLVARPLVGPLHVRRAGEPRPDHVGQVAQRRHDLRPLEPLFLDALDRVSRG